MATLHVRNVPEELYERLRQRAEAENRSLSAEVIHLLEGKLGEGDRPRLVQTANTRRRSFGPDEVEPPLPPGLLHDDHVVYQLEEDLQIPSDIVEKASAFADQHGTSLARLISEYLRRLEPDDLLASAPIVRRLAGTLPPDVSLADYDRYLDEKYGNGPGGV